MTDSLVNSAVTVIIAIIGVGLVAVILSKNANTSGVIGAGAGGIATDLSSAISPISGSSLGLSFSTSGAE